MRKSFLREMFSNKRVLVVDMTHGGRTLARAIEEYFDAEVLRYDLYGVDKGCEIPEFDICISPVHSPVLNPILTRDPRVISHHSAVGYILRRLKEQVGCDIIEVTGTKGKTSVATMLTHILSSKMQVLSSTSEGVMYASPGGGTAVLKVPGSITPAHALDVMDMAMCKDLAVDVALFEVSLGFTGAAKLNVLTSLEGDYRIAGGMLKASQAKRYMMKNLSGRVVDKGVFDGLKTSFFGERHKKNINLAATAALHLGIAEDEIRRCVLSFPQIRSRMEVKRGGNWIVIDDANSAFDAFNLRAGIEEIMAVDGERIVILGGSRRGSCSSLDIEAVVRVIDVYRDRVRFYLTGEIGEDLRRLGVDCPLIEGDPDGMVGWVMASSSGNKGVILISGSSGGRSG